AVEVPEEMPPRPLPASRLTGFGRQLRLVAGAIEQPPDDGWHRLPAARGRREGLRAGAGDARHAAERRMHAARARIHGVGRAGVAVVARWGRVGRAAPPADPWYGGAQGPSTVVAPRGWTRWRGTVTCSRRDAARVVDRRVGRAADRGDGRVDPRGSGWR